ncbi:hypothetical protein DACRYDRAFT_118518 [Dacryopinax primogenitus]|uniref:F-box domain-containing protein n=1 Tax=Dacryopinax primogenitus (strain DJM 731) TaxID=1858805 RepID=M5FPR5_DACPD|nr:uncharacterized protein DACRYDRAFT_118518 [Dacryopinax primogenitus]EJT98725.1 hypothetical protein DACRYDRAFT_118518 [Dacryopinax primogenitus]
MVTRGAMYPVKIDVLPRAWTSAFLIPELVHLILEKLDRSTLAAVARTAKSFHVAASSYLWNELDQVGLENLINLAIGVDYQPLCIEHRWARFDLYASMVRSLALNFGAMPGADSVRLTRHLQFIASTRISSQAMLPNLRVLSFQLSSTEHLGVVAAFTCPSLQQLTASCTMDDRVDSLEWDVHIGAFLHKLRWRCLSLKYFKLYGFKYPNVVSFPELTSLIEGTALEHFESDFITFQPNLVQALGRLPTLRCLGLADAGNDEDYTSLERTMFAASIQTGSFVSLHALDLETTSTVALPLLIALRTVPLRHLALRLTEKTFSSPVFKTVFTFIPEFAVTLLSLHAQLVETLEDDEDDEGTLEWKTFAPLYRCHNLQCLKCSVDSHADLELDFGDADIRKKMGMIELKVTHPSGIKSLECSR